jgi:hypothetical protein
MDLHRLTAVPRALVHCSLALSLFAAGCSDDSAAQSQYEQTKNAEQSFVDQFVAAGGTAKFEGRSLVQGKVEGAGWFIDLSGDTIPDELIDAMVERRKNDMFFDLNFSGSTLTDDQLAKLDAGNVLDYTYVLDLSNTQVSDAGLDKCTHLYILSELKIKGSKITKEGADRLGERKVKDPLTPSMFKRKPKVEM